MSQSITLADLTVANDGPVDRVEYARRSVIASKSVQEFTTQTAGPALDSLIALASEADAADPASTKRLAEDLTEQARTLLAEVTRFTDMTKKV